MTPLRRKASTTSEVPLGLRIQTRLPAFIASNGGSNEREHAINKKRKVDDPNVANTSCPGRGNLCQSDGHLERRIAALEQEVRAGSEPPRTRKEAKPGKSA
jgi:hypothetical protein